MGFREQSSSGHGSFQSGAVKYVQRQFSLPENVDVNKSKPMLYKMLGIWLYYRLFLIPALISSIAVSMFAAGQLFGSYMATVFIILNFLFHWIGYSFFRQNDYIFYHHIGLSKPLLWNTTTCLSTMLYFIFRFLG